MNVIEKGLLFGPFARDEIRGVIADIFPKRGLGVSLSVPQSREHRAEFLFEVRLLAGEDVVVHADRDHGSYS